MASRFSFRAPRGTSDRSRFSTMTLRQHMLVAGRVVREDSRQVLTSACSECAVAVGTRRRDVAPARKHALILENSESSRQGWQTSRQAPAARPPRRALGGARNKDHARRNGAARLDVTSDAGRRFLTAGNQWRCFSTNHSHHAGRPPAQLPPVRLPGCSIDSRA